MYHIVYKTTIKPTGEYYYGKHSAKKLMDTYRGSNKGIDEARSKYGQENLIRENIAVYDNELDAFEHEARLVTKETISDPKCLNERRGGKGGFKGMKVLKNLKTNEIKAFKPEDNIPNDWVGIRRGSEGKGCSGKVTCKTEDGVVKQVTKEEFDSSTNLVGATSGKTMYINSKGESLYLSIDDPRVLSGEFYGHNKGYKVMKDKDGNTHRVSVDDPRIASGDLVHVNVGKTSQYKNTITCIDKDGNVINKIPNDDVRLISGEFKPKNKRLKLITNGKEIKYDYLSNYDKNDWRLY